MKKIFKKLSSQQRRCNCTDSSTSGQPLDNEKIDQSDKFLQEKMENTGINPVLAELKSWFLPMQKIEKSLKKWHYDRLNNPMQQAWALPQSQEEAIRRGFLQAPESQNFLPPE